MASVDWILSIFFVAALFLVLKLKKQISAAGGESYRNLSGGLIVLALVALARVYHGLGMFETVPFVSEPVFYELISWIGLITGATFVVSGVSNWLPLARNHRRYSEARIQHLDLLRKVEQLIGVETRLNIILGTTLQYMADSFRFSFGAVFKYSPRRNELRLTATAGDAPSAGEQLIRVTVDQQKLQVLCSGVQSNPPDLFAGLPRKLGRPKVVLPIMVGNQPAGFFLLWSGSRTEYDMEDELTLRLAVDVIARKVETDQLVLRNQAAGSRRVWQDQLLAAVNSCPKPEDRFTTVMDRIAEKMPLDYGALTILEADGGRMRRLSIGRNRQVLVEAGQPVPPLESLTGPAYWADLRVVIGDLQEHRQPTAVELLTDNDVRSLVALPIAVDGRTRAVLTIAACKKDAYAQTELDSLGCLLPVLSSLAVRNEAQYSLGRQRERLEKLSGFVSRVGRFRTLSQAFEEAARLISEELPYDMVRIVTVDDDGLFLKSRALVSLQPVKGVVPADGQLIVSLMPLHERVLKDTQHVDVGDTETVHEMTDIEARQAFVSGVEAALIVPIVSAQQAVGTISLARFARRSHQASDPATLVFAKAMANALAAVIDFRLLAQSRDKTATESELSSFGAIDLRNRLKSSLTGILGSVELLKSHTFGTDERTNRYLSIIDRSARKLDNCLREETQKQP